MSKRFGRNQKRRMREQIQQAEKRADLYQQWYRDLKMLSERDTQIVAETARVLGRHFMTLSPETQVVHHLDMMLQEGWRVPYQKGIGDMWEMAGNAPSYQTFMEVVLPAMYGSAVADDLSQHMHFVIQYGGTKTAYAIQKESLLMLEPRDAVRRIIEQMAEHLYNGLADERRAS